MGGGGGDFDGSRPFRAQPITQSPAATRSKTAATNGPVRSLFFLPTPLVAAQRGRADVPDGSSLHRSTCLCSTDQYEYRVVLSIPDRRHYKTKQSVTVIQALFALKTAFLSRATKDWLLFRPLSRSAKCCYREWRATQREIKKRIVCAWLARYHVSAEKKHLLGAERKITTASGVCI